MSSSLLVSSGNIFIPKFSLPFVKCTTWTYELMLSCKVFSLLQVVNLQSSFLKKGSNKAILSLQRMK